MLWFAREICDILDASVVLALGLRKLDTDPLARREGRGANESHNPTPCCHLDKGTQRWVHLENERKLEGNVSLQLVLDQTRPTWSMDQDHVIYIIPCGTEASTDYEEPLSFHFITNCSVLL